MLDNVHDKSFSADQNTMHYLQVSRRLHLFFTFIIGPLIYTQIRTHIYRYEYLKKIFLWTSIRI